MAVDVLVGTQWGDEGKGKLIDVLTKDVDMVVRFRAATTQVILSKSVTNAMSFTSFLQEFSVQV